MISMGQECSICIQHGGDFIWSLGLRLNDFNFYMMVRKICCLYSVIFLLWAIVLKVVKVQVIWNCSEQNIFILVDKMFQHISAGLQYWLTDYSQIYCHIVQFGLSSFCVITLVFYNLPNKCKGPSSHFLLSGFLC